MKWLRSTFHPRHLIWLALGAALFGAWDTYQRSGPAVTYETVVEQGIAVRGGFMELVVDRVRTKVCPTRETRILIRNEAVAGETMPVVIPLSETGLIWPQLGPSKYTVLVPLPGNLPTGEWNTQTISTDYCHWWNALIGGHTRVSAEVPIRVQNPPRATAPTTLQTAAPVIVVPPPDVTEPAPRPAAPVRRNPLVPDGRFLP